MNYGTEEQDRLLSQYRKLTNFGKVYTEHATKAYVGMEVGRHLF
jgi:hypothetical protein